MKEQKSYADKSHDFDLLLFRACSIIQHILYGNYSDDKHLSAANFWKHFLMKFVKQ